MLSLTFLLLIEHLLDGKTMILLGILRIKSNWPFREIQWHLFLRGGCMTFALSDVNSLLTFTTRRSLKASVNSGEKQGRSKSWRCGWIMFNFMCKIAVWFISTKTMWNERRAHQWFWNTSVVTSVYEYLRGFCSHDSWAKPTQSQTVKWKYCRISATDSWIVAEGTW